VAVQLVRCSLTPCDVVRRLWDIRMWDIRMCKECGQEMTGAAAPPDEDSLSNMLCTCFGCDGTVEGTCTCPTQFTPVVEETYRAETLFVVLCRV
jgi:hypothetical protein